MSSAHDALSVRHYGASPGSHAHGYRQILVGLDGTLELEVEGRGRRVSAGAGLVIGPGDRHDFEAATGARCLVLDSADSAWDALTDITPPPRLLDLARYLAVACEASLPLATSAGAAWLLEAWAPTAQPVRMRRPIDWSSLRTWAQQQLDAALCVADLAAQVHLSEAQFRERCRAELRQSPMAWLRGLRLQQARQLRAQGLPVSEVALRCGYLSPSALTAALGRQDGASPANLDD